MHAKLKKTISTQKAPAAIGPYSQAVVCGNLVFLSGQIPLDPKTMQLVEGNIQIATKQVFNNIAAVLEAAELDFTDVVRLTIYLTNMQDFAVVNEVMQQYCSEPYPARAAVEVSNLPKGATIEIDAIACYSKS